MFKVTRIYSDKDGESHFEEIRIPLHQEGVIGSLSQGQRVKEIIFREVEPAYDYDFHTAPQRQYVILLDGSIQIETSLGEHQNFGAGDVLLLEDVEGKGHRTKNLEPVRRRSLFITLP